MVTKKKPTPRYVLCIRNKGCDDLELRKLYQVVADRAATKEGHLRIIDESGEDYLYPGKFFRTLSLPKPVQRALRSSEN